MIRNFINPIIGLSSLLLPIYFAIKFIPPPWVISFVIIYFCCWAAVIVEIKAPGEEDFDWLNLSYTD
jgi:hypothetical protein